MDGFPREVIARQAEEIKQLTAENAKLKVALSAMLTHMGMDEDEWNRPTFNQAREALKETKWGR